MRELAIRFLTFQALNDHPMIHLGLVLAWLVLLAASIMSLRQQPFSLAKKWMWFAVILLLPLVGVGLYALRCLLTSDFSFLKFLLGPGGTAKSVRPR
jgi:hypothetical protein